MGDCFYCGESAGLLRSKHQECEYKNADGYRQMVRAAARAASNPEFDEANLQQVLTTIAERSYVDRTGVRAAILEGWRDAVNTKLNEPDFTQEEETRLLDFRDRLALNDDLSRKTVESIWERSIARLVAVASQAALPGADSETNIQVLHKAMDESSLPPDKQRSALIRAWEEAVQTTLSSQESGVESFTAEKGASLVQYLRSFGLEQKDVDSNGIYARLLETYAFRLVFVACQAALPSADSETKLHFLQKALEESSLSQDQQHVVLISAWEEAAQIASRGKLITLEEGEALFEYLRVFNLTQEDVNKNGHYERFEQAIVIREVTEGIVPQRFNVIRLPVNLQRSEQMVWAFYNVNYSEVKTISEFRGSSQGVGIPVAKTDLNLSQIRGQVHDREETIRVGPGFLGITTKHIYFHGGSKSFRVPYDEIVSFERLPDGFGITRDVRDAKPERFRTGDGWFAYNLVTNLARL